jgi:hypothetical protein
MGPHLGRLASRRQAARMSARPGQPTQPTQKASHRAIQCLSPRKRHGLGAAPPGLPSQALSLGLSVEVGDSLADQRIRPASRRNVVVHRSLPSATLRGGLPASRSHGGLGAAPAIDRTRCFPPPTRPTSASTGRWMRTSDQDAEMRSCVSSPRVRREHPADPSLGRPLPLAGTASPGTLGCGSSSRRLPSASPRLGAELVTDATGGARDGRHAKVEHHGGNLGEEGGTPRWNLVSVADRPRSGMGTSGIGRSSAGTPQPRPRPAPESTCRSARCRRTRRRPWPPGRPVEAPERTPSRSRPSLLRSSAGSSSGSLPGGAVPVMSVLLRFRPSGRSPTFQASADGVATKPAEPSAPIA